tara:strand:+ start:2555 stop:3505 length:951 start_codon:yes stop_codon:yes gene_type:complete
MALLQRKRVILIETESGTSEATIDAVDAVQVIDLSITPQSSDVVNRDVVRPYFGASEQLLANTKVECTFSVEMAGSGTPGTVPRYSKALEACGMKETVSGGNTVTYKPMSTGIETVTIHYNVDGVLHKAINCRGTFSLACEVGAIPRIDFTFTGEYVAPTASALPSITYGDQASPLIFKNGNTTGFELLSYAGLLQSVTMDLGNTVEYRELVGGTTAKEVLITDRAASGSVSIEAPALGTKDYFAAALTEGSLGNLQFLHGTTAGNKVQFISSKVDIGDVAYSDMQGVVMLDIPFTLVPSASSTAAEGDEFSLIYT